MTCGGVAHRGTGIRNELTSIFGVVGVHGPETVIKGKCLHIDQATPDGLY